MNVGPWQLVIIALVILVLFGRGRISEMMGDFGKGIKSFKRGMHDEDKTVSAPPQIGQTSSGNDDAGTTASPAESGKTTGGN